ncbi:MAG: ribosome small subunit-dependent GTPase A [Mangrovibacterium sp.]|nr:ribosome small subunit-dependent GTPase A [Mangrovibacterium sp.]
MSEGIVIKSTGSWFSVKTESGMTVDCKLKGNFRIRDLKSTNPVAVGDHVEISLPEQAGDDPLSPVGLITDIVDRKNYIIRKSPNLSKQYQIIASNIDQAFLIATINYPVTTTTFIDRFLASAEAYRIPCSLIFNKIDRYNSGQMSQMQKLMEIYRKIGYRCMETSARKNHGINEVKELMKGKISVFSGHSGVGKSTLINNVEPRLNLKTREISDYHEMGKHTTTFSEMFELSFGGFIIDTPGIKGFGVLEMEKEEIGHYFPEIFRRLKKCQYSNCTHTHEPGCEVKRAVAEKEIAESRYLSYLGLLEPDKRYRS